MMTAKGLDKDVIREMENHHRQTKEAHVSYTKEQLKVIFLRYDKNKDGKLSRQELKDAFRSLGAIIPQYRAHKALHYADKNGDGYISDNEVEDLIRYAYELGYKVT